MYEGDMLKNNASKLMKTRYIVEVVPHGNGKNTLKKEDDEEETDFLTNNEQDSSASWIWAQGLSGVSSYSINEKNLIDCLNLKVMLQSSLYLRLI